MLDHVSITASDIAAAERFYDAMRFYDAIMKTLEIVKVGRHDDWLAYGPRSMRSAASPQRHLKRCPPSVCRA